MKMETTIDLSDFCVRFNRQTETYEVLKKSTGEIRSAGKDFESHWKIAADWRRETT
jgi:hypothetical protein